MKSSDEEFFLLDSVLPKLIFSKRRRTSAHEINKERRDVDTMPKSEADCTLESNDGKKRKKGEFKNQPDVYQGNESISTNKKKKKKLKEKIVNSSNHADEQYEQTFEYEKCEKHDKSEESLIVIHEKLGKKLTDSPVNEQTVKKKKKKKKTKEKETQSPGLLSEDGGADEVPLMLEANKKKKKKKVKKEGREESKEEKSDLRKYDEDRRKENKRTKKEYIKYVEVLHDEQTDIKKDDEKKKKKNKDKHEQFVSVEDNITSKENDSLTAVTVSTTVAGTSEQLEHEKKKSKKGKYKLKRKSCSDVDTSKQNESCEIEDDCNILSVSGAKKKKKKRKRELEVEKVCNAEDYLSDSCSKSKKKKKKRENDKGETLNERETPSHQPHTTPNLNLFKNAVFESAERESQFSRVTGTSIKKDDDKREADSSMKSDVNELSSPAFNKGQWQGALFENKERQNKFLRLLGGMKSQNCEKTKMFSSQKSAPKKGLYGSLISNKDGENKALSYSDAADTNKRLEEDYNKAMNFRLSGTKKGGLGFAPDPAEGKKFHIDATSTKSVKFDDG